MLTLSNIHAAVRASPIHIVCSLEHLQHVIFTPSIHVCQFLEAGSPFAEAVVVLVSTARRVQGREASCVRAASFIVKHQQGVVGGRCRVVVSCLQVLGEEKRTYLYTLQNQVRFGGTHKYQIKSLRNHFNKVMTFHIIMTNAQEQNLG